MPRPHDELTVEVLAHVKKYQLVQSVLAERVGLSTTMCCLWINSKDPESTRYKRDAVFTEYLADPETFVHRAHARAMERAAARLADNAQSAPTKQHPHVAWLQQMAARVSAATSEGSTSLSPASHAPRLLPVGTHCRLSGLVVCADLNGLGATVESFDSDSGRYTVTVLTGDGEIKRIAVLPERLGPKLSKTAFTAWSAADECLDGLQRHGHDKVQVDAAAQEASSSAAAAAGPSVSARPAEREMPHAWLATHDLSADEAARVSSSFQDAAVQNRLAAASSAGFDGGPPAKLARGDVCPGGDVAFAKNLVVVASATASQGVAGRTTSAFVPAGAHGATKPNAAAVKRSGVVPCPPALGHRPSAPPMLGQRPSAGPSVSPRERRGDEWPDSWTGDPFVALREYIDSLPKAKARGGSRELLRGWSATRIQRDPDGSCPKAYDDYFYSSDGRRFRSRVEVARALSLLEALPKAPAPAAGATAAKPAKQSKPPKPVLAPAMPPPKATTSVPSPSIIGEPSAWPTAL